MNDSDLKQLAQEHLDDAMALQGSQRFAGAIYLAGYAVECALKFRICQTLGWSDFPPNSDHRALKSHDLNFLLNYSGMLLETKKTYSFLWERAAQWNPEMRYRTLARPNAAECHDFISTAFEFVKLFTEQ
jgi:hypothetical protein